MFVQSSLRIDSHAILLHRLSSSLRVGKGVLYYCVRAETPLRSFTHAMGPFRLHMCPLAVCPREDRNSELRILVLRVCSVTKLRSKALVRYVK